MSDYAKFCKTMYAVSVQQKELEDAKKQAEAHEKVMTEYQNAAEAFCHNYPDIPFEFTISEERIVFALDNALVISGRYNIPSEGPFTINKDWAMNENYWYPEKNNLPLLLGRALTDYVPKVIVHKEEAFQEPLTRSTAEKLVDTIREIIWEETRQG